jgi:hypothetical protein
MRLTSSPRSSFPSRHGKIRPFGRSGFVEMGGGCKGLAAEALIDPQLLKPWVRQQYGHEYLVLVVNCFA